jgi:hypothetical protein
MVASQDAAVTHQPAMVAAHQIDPAGRPAGCHGHRWFFIAAASEKTCFIDFIRPKDPNFPTVHRRIRDDRRAYPHFKGCIGALFTPMNK